MNSKQVLEFIENPGKLQKAEAEDLQRVTEEYPYSGVLHALYLKALKNQNNYLYPKQLKRTAISVPDRKVLYYWAEGEVEESKDLVEKPQIVFKAEEKKAEKETEKKPEKEVIEPVKKQVQVAEKPKVEAPAKVNITTPKSKPKPVEASTTKSDDVDLSALPASVRETVLRARKIRDQFGKKYDNAEPEKQSETKPKPVTQEVAEEQPIEKKVEEPLRKAEKRAETVSEPEVENIAAQETSDKQEAKEIEAKPIVEEKVAEPEEKPAIIIEAPTEQANEAQEKVEEEPAKAAPVESSQPAEKEKHSFLDWLDGAEMDEPAKDEDETEQEIETKPEEKPAAEAESAREAIVQQEEVHAVQSEKPSTEKVKDLYESFMETRPKPKLTFKAERKPIEAAKLDSSEYSPYITETLAQIYAQQKLFDRAINAYEILRLKYPEKSSFFAARISEIKESLNENS